MPCSDPDAGSYYAAKLEEKVHELTRLLCEACGRLQHRHGGLSPELEAWWREHQEADARRRKEEKRRKNLEQRRDAALAKLTAEERDLLGLE